MVVWNHEWLAVHDINGDKIGDWAEMIDNVKVKCKWCSGNAVKYASKGKQSLDEHARVAKHSQNSKLYSASIQIRLRFVPIDQESDAVVPGKKINSIQCFMTKDKNVMDELLWTMNIIKKKSSFLSAKVFFVMNFLYSNYYIFFIYFSAYRTQRLKKLFSGQQ
jgi:hypothetical protein